MAYGQLYSFEYKDFLGRLTTVKIYRDNYTGASSEILAAGDPVIIESKTDDNYMFSTLFGSTCQINLMSETNMQFADLFSANAFKHKVEVWKEPEPDEPQALFWAGFILPDQYSEPLDFVANYPVSITCRDAIGALKEIDFLQTSGNRYVGKQQVIRIIAECLKKTQLNIPINFAVYLEETNAPAGATDDPLEMIFLDYAVFYKDDTETKIQNTEFVLKQILQSFGCRLVQSWGEWWIEQVVLYTGVHPVHRYTYEGVYVSTSSVNPLKTYTGKYDATNNRLFFAEKQGLLEINPAFKGFIINQDYGKKESIFENYNFKEGYYPELPPSQKFYPYNWDRVLFDPTSGSFAPNDTYGESTLSIKKSPLFDGIIFMDANNVSLRSAQIYISITSEKSLYIELHSEYFGGGVDVWMEIKLGGVWFRLTGTSGENCAVETSVYYNQLYYWSNDAPTNIAFTLVGNYSGYLSFRIAGTGNLKKITTKFINQTQNNIEYPNDAQFEVTIDSNNNEKPDEIDSILGDLPELTDNEDVYIGGYWYFDGSTFVPTRSWTVPGSNRNLVLLGWLAENINDQYITPKQRISGRLIGNFSFNQSLLISFMSSKIYLPNRLSLSDKYCKWTVEMIELLNGQDWGGTVLATYNDEVYATTDDELIKV